jgi:hypothetical protein
MKDSKDLIIIIKIKAFIHLNIYFINVFVAKLVSTAVKFLIWKERGGRGEKERQR